MQVVRAMATAKPTPLRLVSPCFVPVSHVHQMGVMRSSLHLPASVAQMLAKLCQNLQCSAAGYFRLNKEGK